MVFRTLTYLVRMAYLMRFLEPRPVEKRAELVDSFLNPRFRLELTNMKLWLMGRPTVLLA